MKIMQQENMKITVKYTEGLHENDDQIHRKAT